MGIPSYYKSIIQEYPDIIRPCQQKYDHLFLDLNCAIHPCCANKTNENEMMESIFQKIKECIQITQVTQLVYIAIDGPAPRTKMEQQRHRRLRSAKENKPWDTNAITPGTPFMNQLNLFLMERCKELTIPFILSDSNEPGEGEHKIMKYLDENIHEKTNNVVYGLDADLIMLSMIRKHTIHLLRERTEYNIEQMDDPYIYLDVQRLKKYVISTIKKPFTKIDNETILYDYLFLCFLIGNDFIINTPCINIRYNGIFHLLEVYNELQQEFFGQFFLTNQTTIHWDHFKRFIQKVSSYEKSWIDTILLQRKKQQHRNKRNYQKILHKIQSIEDIPHFTYQDFNSVDERQFDQFVNFSPLIFRDNEEIIFKNDNYRKKYYIYNIYDTLEYNPSYDMIIESDIHTICKEYLKSIEWTFHYYFNECKSWRWYYRYNFAPLMTDLNEYLKENSLSLFQKDNPYTPKEQLQIVLPFQKKNDFYYPLDSPLYSFMKNYSWECHQILTHS